MENNLTPQQRQAVENRGGKLLVSAAAGSGKTKVLVDRLMLYLMDPVSPSNIDDFLIITYTKAAAAELRGKIAARISEYLAENPENRHLQRQMQRLYLAKISTVHSFCTDLLREYAYELDLPGDFRVADENECRQLREQAMNETLDEAYASGLDDPDFRCFVDTQGLGRDDRLVPEIVLKVYDSARCHLNPEQWLDYCVESAAVDEATDAAQTVWGGYLLKDLHRYLDQQIRAMEDCVALAEKDPALAKVTVLLSETVLSLRELRAAQNWDQVVERRKINYGTLRFPKKVDDPELPERIKAVRNGCKDSLEKRLKVFCDPSAQVLADLGQTSGAVRGLVGMAQAFGCRYQALKRRRRVLDFSDLEHHALDLVLGKKRSAPTRLAREVGERFREVLGDEYQDSNAVQDAIFSALTARKQNCFMVGDVKQSIYQFRLADPGIFLEKYAAYADAENAADGEGRKVLLRRNFRSGGAILEATNDVFRRCMTNAVGGLDYGDDEALWEGFPHEGLGEPEVELQVIRIQEDAYLQEAEFVARRISQLLDGTHMIRGKEGLRPIEEGDIVILLRSPGSVGQVFQDALASRGIRSAFGSGRDLLQTGEISVLRSILQIISNPRQDIPLLAALASPVFGFSADDLARVRAGRKYGDFYDAIRQDETEQSRKFLNALKELREVSRTATLSQLLEHIFLTTRLDSIYAAMDSGAERTANLREFFRMAMDFEATARRDLSQFLEHLELLEENGLTMPESSSGGMVSILSIHKSKGLEYPVVFLSALARSFNRENLRAPVLCDGELGLGLSAVDPAVRVRYPTVAKRAIVSRVSRESLSEELRVLYVAMTRARDRLIMTYAAKTPEKELRQIALQMELGGTELLAGEVSCPGEWVLMEAMCRTEAGSLFALADARPGACHTAEYPWLIQTHEGQGEAVSGEKIGEQAVQPMPADLAERLERSLAFRYPYSDATRTPSKQTATQLKGREKDQEAAENAPPEIIHRKWRTLSDGLGKPGGREYGTAMHTLMQYIRFENCGTARGLEDEISRLEQRGILTPEQAALADREGILAFFGTDIGREMMTGEVIREFKFSILTDAGEGELAGEQILLQGVVDCALITEDGILLVDFKTDRVSEQTLETAVSGYRPQVQAYAHALARIFEKPVRRSLLWFFHLRQAVEV